MTEAKTIQGGGTTHFDATDSRMRSLALNVALTIGTLTTVYFGIGDVVRHRALAALVSLLAVIVFVATLLINMLVPRLRSIVYVCFVTIVGIVFLTLLATQFPDPAIVFWCFPFPLIALFLLGRGQGAVALIAYNVGVMLVFYLDVHVASARYTYDYGIRYSGAMIVISVLSYYYEALRARSITFIQSVNLSLEQRVQERTKALEESQERLRQAEKLEAIGLLAGGIAHDFNNHLTSIMAFADLIRVTAKDNAEIRELAEGILAGSRRSADLTGQLLAFARKANLLAVPVDVHRVIADVTSLLKHTIDKRIIIRHDLAAAPSTILGDPTQLENALLNLALNARDAMPSGGELLFATSIAELDDAYCRTIPHEVTPGTYLRVSVSDTGCGMDEKTRNRIFEPFFTTKAPGKGTGMGLPAVYGTVRSLNGAIAVYSEPGHGSSFHLYFPVLPIAGEAPHVSAEPSPTDKGHGHVLVVDDEKTVSAAVSKLLQSMGYTVTVRGNGKEALEFYTSNWKSVDLVLLDMIMPVMGGKDAFVAMQKINPGIVALLSSGYSLNGEAQSMLDAGVAGFMQKPFTIAELRAKIGPLLGRGA
jgi:signal transduction histidine kinase